MRRFSGKLMVMTGLVVALCVLVPGTAAAAFGLHSLKAQITDEEGVPSMQAGSHPFALTTSFRANTEGTPGSLVVSGAVKELTIELPEGMIGDPSAVTRCSTTDFLSVDIQSDYITECPDSAAVGYTSVVILEGGNESEADKVAIYNLEPPPGVAVKLGFWAVSVPVTLEVGLKQEPPFNAVVSVRNVSQLLEFTGAETVVWGNPSDPRHNALRGDRCLRGFESSCPVSGTQRPLITLPRRCSGPLKTLLRAVPWWDGDPLNASPGETFEGIAETQDDSMPPQPTGLGGCSRIGFGPRMEVKPTTESADSPTGLTVGFEVNDPGLTSPEGIAQSDVKKVVVELPEGMTANPALAEGLAACSPAQLSRETLAAKPGEGCPEASKVGTMEAETPLLEGELIKGSLVVATPDDPSTPAKGQENPFDTLLAVYMIVKHPKRGVLIKLPGKIEPNPRTGQLVSTFDDLPQVPLSRVRLRLREGGRSPLVSPPTCGQHTTRAEFTPWVDPGRTVVTTSSFSLNSGPGGGPCPGGGVPPFKPGFSAGSVDNNAGAFSPFYMRITRRDGDQDLTRFSATLPRGVLAKIAGTTRCSNQQIEAARHQRGMVELVEPSCPASSRLGYAIGGAGVGSQPLYVEGDLYLAGPYNGAPLSVVAIVPAVAGPFDVGTVVTRQALVVHPRTGEVRVDGERSDPLPYILAGIPLRVKDIRVLTDRPQLTLNPTSCAEKTALVDLWGGGLNPFSTADDAPVAVSQRYQAANCASLGFKPRLSLTLSGGTRRGTFPALRAVFRPRPGDANLRDMSLRMPRSAFLEQGHFRTICTRVQFAADACPPGATYGKVRAFTPLLDEPLEGDIILRSSSNKLPDMVLDLHGIVDVEAVAQIDSFERGIRATILDAPDAPISKVVVSMQGGKKGLIVNSRDLCAKPARAKVELTAQNGRKWKAGPKVRATGCKKKVSAKKAGRR